MIRTQFFSLNRTDLSVYYSPISHYYWQYHSNTIKNIKGFEQNEFNLYHIVITSIFQIPLTGMI